MVDEISSKVTQNMFNEKIQNGFNAVNKTAEMFSNSTGGNKTKKNNIFRFNKKNKTKKYKIQI